MAMKEKALDTWNEATIIKNTGACSNSAANRFYYSLFQSIFAFGDRQQTGIQKPPGYGGKHKYVLDIARKYISASQRRLFMALIDLQGLRGKADYEESNVVADDLDDELLKDAEDLLNYFDHLK